MNKSLRLVILKLAFLLLLSANSFGQFSMFDKHYFSESPKIVHRDGRCFVRYKYGTFPDNFSFFFATCSKIKDDKLVFSLPCTASSGHRTEGQLQFEEIKNHEKIQLIKEGVAFWLEPDKTLTALSVDSLADDAEWLKARATTLKH